MDLIQSYSSDDSDSDHVISVKENEYTIESFSDIDNSVKNCNAETNSDDIQTSDTTDSDSDNNDSIVNYHVKTNSDDTHISDPTRSDSDDSNTGESRYVYSHFTYPGIEYLIGKKKSAKTD